MNSSVPEAVGKDSACFQKATLTAWRDRGRNRRKNTAREVQDRGIPGKNSAFVLESSVVTPSLGLEQPDRGA